MEDAIAIAQHHDAISGTEKQHVANDYSKRLAVAVSVGEASSNQVLATLIGDSAALVQQCRLMNESLCDPLVTTGSANTGVIIYNQGATRVLLYLSVCTSCMQT